MFSNDLKRAISEKVQQILQDTKHPELPDSEINFILHVDGAEISSWANITNNNKNYIQIPNTIIRNLSK